MPSSQANQGVSLVTGKTALPLTLVSAPGQNGLDIEVQVFNTSHVSREAATWNQDAPTGILGLGWSLPQTAIVRDTRGSASESGEALFLVESGANRLRKTAEGSDAHGFYREYAAENYQFWQIRHYPQAETWRIVKEDGTTYEYGGLVGSGGPGPLQSVGDSVQWAVGWGSWAGASTRSELDTGASNGQSQFAVVWNLSAIRNPFGQSLHFSYLQDRVNVGAGGRGLPYTRASYLAEIRSDPGYRVSFVYGEKDPSEYPASRVLSGGTNAYQDRVETRYLQAVRVSNENGTPLYSAQLGYRTLGSGPLAKRVLATLTRVSAEGRAYEPAYAFTYYGESTADGVSVSLTDDGGAFNAGTGALYGALRTVTAPSGEVATYRYASLVLENTERALEGISPPKSGGVSWGRPALYFGADYVVVMWRGRGTVHLTVYQWRGSWRAQELGAFPADTGCTEVYAGADFFALVAPKQKQSFHLFRRSRTAGGEWIAQDVTATLGSAYQAGVGDDLFAALETDTGKLYRFAWDGEQWQAPPPSPWQVDTDDAAVFGMAVAGNVVFVVNARPDNSIRPTLRLLYLRQDGAWYSTQTTVDPFFDAKGSKYLYGVSTSASGVEALELRAGNSFVALRATATTTVSSGKSVTFRRDFRHFALRWSRDQLRLFTDPLRDVSLTWMAGASGPTSTMEVAGDLVSIAVSSESAKTVHRFDGVAWSSRKLTYDRDDRFLGLDATLEVSTSWGTKDTKLQQYDPRTGTWSAQVSFSGTDVAFYETLWSILSFVATTVATAPLGFWEGLVVGTVLDQLLSRTPLAGGVAEEAVTGLRYLAIDNALYVRNPDGTWSGLGSLLSGKQLSHYKTLALADDYLAYMTSEVAGSSGTTTMVNHLRNRVVLLRNGRVVKTLSLEAGPEAALTIEPSEEQPVLMGPGTLAAYPRQGYRGTQPYTWKNDFRSATTFNLYRVVDGAFTGALRDVVVARVEAFDGYQTVHTCYDYDTGTAVYDPLTGLVQYNRATVAAGAPTLAGARALGWTDHYFYNGSLAPLPHDPTWDVQTGGIDTRIPPADPPDSLVDPLIADAGYFPELVAGKAYHRRTYAGGAVAPRGGEVPAVATQTVYWKVHSRVLGGARRGFYLRSRQVAETVDGLSTLVRYTYDLPTGPADAAFRSGLLRGVRTSNYAVDGTEEVVTTRLTYGWEVYPALRDAHLLGPVVQTTTVRTPQAAGAQPSVRASATTWQADAFGVWAPRASFEWLGTGASAFSAWGGGGPGAGWLKTSEITRVERGIVLEVQDAEGVVRSRVYDRNRLFPVARFENASAAAMEAAYTGFEPYEDLGRWSRLDDANWRAADHGGDASVVPYLARDDAYTGAVSLRVSPGMALGMGDIRNPLLSAWAQDETFVLSAFVKTSAGFAADPGRASLALQVTNPGRTASGLTVPLEITDTGGDWRLVQHVVELGTLRTGPWEPGDPLSLGILIANEKANASFLLDDVCLSPLRSRVAAHVFDPDHRDLVAELDENGRTNRYARDDLRREVGMVQEGRVANLVAGHFSRAGSANGAFDPAEPNAALVLSARTGGSYFEFRAGDAGGWSGGRVAARELVLDGSGTATLPQEGGDYGVRLQVRALAGPKPRWTAAVPAELGQVIGRGAVDAKGRYYVSTATGWLVAFGPDGTLAWKVQLEDFQGVMLQVVVGPDGTVYAASSTSSTLHALAADATRKWAYRSPTGTVFAPAFGPDGTVYVPDFRALHALDPANGKELWSCTYPDPTVGSISSPAVAPDGTVYVGLSQFGNDPAQGALCAVDPRTRGLRWIVPTEGGITTPPVPAPDGTVYVATAALLYAFAPDRRRKWMLTPPGGSTFRGPPALGGGGVYVVGSTDDPKRGASGTLHAVDAGGTVRWASGFPMGGPDTATYLTAPAVAADGSVYLSFDDGYRSGLLSVGPDGSPRWTEPFSVADMRGGAVEQIETVPVLGADGAVYVNAAPGEGVYAFEPGGRPLTSDSLTVALGGAAVRWAAGKYTLVLGGSETGTTAPGPLAADWLLFAVDDTLYFHADGRRLFAQRLGSAVGGGVTLAVSGDAGRGLAFGEVLVFRDPVVSVDYRDGSGIARQAQYVEGGASVVVSETLYDSLGRVAFRTIPARKGAGAAAPGVLGFEPGFVAGRDPLGGDALWSTAPGDPARGVMGGLIQQWLDPDFRTRYPYTGQVYESSPLSRLTELTYSDADFVRDAGHAIRFSYGPGDAAKGLMAEMGIPQDRQDRFPVQTQVNPLGDAASIASVEIRDREGRTLAAGATGAGASVLSTSRYAFESSGGLTVTTRLPNAYAPRSGESGDPFVRVQRLDALDRLASVTTPDEGTARYVYDRSGRVRFAQDADLARDGRVLYRDYDRLGRPVEAGWLRAAWDAAALQAVAWGSRARPAGTWLQRLSWDRDDDGSVAGLRGRLAKAVVRGSAEVAAAPDARGVTHWYAYDRLGNVLRESTAAAAYDADRYPTDYGYDNHGRVTSIAYPVWGEPVRTVAPRVYYTDTRGEVVLYDPAGGASHALVPPTVRALAIDPPRQLVYLASTQGILQMGYDAGNRRQVVADPAVTALAVDADGKLYWVRGNAAILRSGPDGSGPETLVTGRSQVVALAVDAKGGWLYWMEAGPGIFRAKVDGTQVANLVPNTGGFGLALDLANGRLYWTAKLQLMRAGLDGSGPERLLAGESVLSFAVEPDVRRVYWVDPVRARLRSADLDGGDAQTLAETAPYSPQMMVMDLVEAQAGSIDVPVSADTTVRYAYDRLGRVAAVGRPDSPRAYATYDYNADGSIRREVLNPAAINASVARDYSYDSLGWLIRIRDRVLTQTLGYQDGEGSYLDGSVATLGFAFAPGTSVAGKIPVDHVYALRHDPLGRLVAARCSGVPAAELVVGDGQGAGGYDADGNLLQVALGGVATTYHYAPGTDRLQSTAGAGGTQAFSHTPAGRVSATPALASLGYDALSGLPASATRADGATVALQHGADGGRVLKTVRDANGLRQTLSLRGNGPDPLVERTRAGAAPGAPVRYVYGPAGLVAFNDGTADYFVARDHVGSTRVVFAADGSPAAFFNYLPFGGEMPGNCSGGPVADRLSRRFSGQDRDADLGVYDFRARLYDPGLGRFYAPDPASQYPSPYVYAGNSPVDLADPDGELANPFGSLLERLAGRGAARGAASVARGAARRAEEAALSRIETEEVQVWAEEELACAVSFAAGTPVAAEAGLRPVEEIAVGDRVWGWDAARGEPGLYGVTRLHRRVSEESVGVRLAGEEVHTTPEHPFWLVGHGWRAAGDLRPGDRLQALDGGTVEVESAELRAGELEVFNFEVAEVRNYFVSGARILVHNPAKKTGVCAATRGYQQRLARERSHGVVSRSNIVVGRRLRRPPAALGRSGYTKRHNLTGAAAIYGHVYTKPGPLPGTRYVDFSPHVVRTPGGQKMTLRIQYSGTRAGDYAQGDMAFNITPMNRSAQGWTWHHVPDVDSTGHGTLELVPTALHNAVGHYGGVEQYRALAMANALGWPNFY